MPAPTLRELGERIAAWRTERGMDQTEFGRLLGKSQRTVSAIENGAVTLAVLLRAMDKLGKTFQDLEPGQAEKRLGAPRTHPPTQGEGEVPYELYVSTVEALTRRIRTLEARKKEAPLTDAEVEEMGDTATGEPRPQSDENQTGGNLHKKPPGSGRKKG